MSNISKNVIDAIQLITEKQLNEAKFDRTLLMKIISCTNPNTGEYKVEYNGATHLAYAASGYLFNEGEMVYILAPEGDLGAQLRILGKENYYQTLDALTTASQQYNRIGDNLINFESASKITVDNTAVARYLTQSDALLVAPTFQVTGVTNPSETFNYGIKISAIFADKGNQELIFDMNDILGNPFNIKNKTTYSSFFSEYDFSKLTEISKVEFFVTDKPSGATVTLSNLELFGCFKSDIAQSTSYAEITGKLEVAENNASVQLTGALYSESSAPKVFNWFVEDPATTTVSTYYSALAGEGWRRVEGSPNAEISINVGTKKYTSVKLVATQGNSKYVATAKIYNKASTNSACINITDTIPPVLTCVTDLSGVDYVWTITDDGGYTSGLATSGNEYTITNYAQYTAPHTFKCGVYKSGELVAIGERRYSNGETVISDFILKLENGSQAFIYNEAGELLSTEQPLTAALYSAAGERISSNLFEVEWSIPNAFESTISSDVCIFNIPHQYNYSLSGNNITAAVRYQGHLISATTSFSFTKNGMMGTNGTNYVCKIRKAGATQFYDFEQLKSGDTIKFEAFAYSVNNPSISVEIKDVKWEIITKVKNPKVKLSGSTVTFASGQTLTAEDIYILSASFKITGDAAQLQYNAILPLVLTSGVSLSYTDGFYSIMYSSAKTNPSYKKNSAFKLTNGVNNGGAWSVFGAQLKLEENNKEYCYVSAIESFISGENNAVYYSVGSSLKMIIPIYCFINRFENVAINNWNGQEFSVSTDGQTVLSPTAGFGTKNTDGSFSGVVLGKAGDINGIYGYQKGKETFKIDENGNATFAGELKAATGSFSGEITASKLTIATNATVSGVATTGQLNAVNTTAVNAQNAANKAQGTADAAQDAADAAQQAAEQAKKELTTFITDKYGPFTENIQQQIDNQSSIYYQAGDPAVYSGDNKWGAEQVGDIWRCTGNTESATSTATNASKVSRAQNSEWVWQKIGDYYGWHEMEIPDNIFDAYDGKATLYTSKPSSYKKNDLWVLDVENANGSNNTYPKYKKGTLLTASQDSSSYSASHWTEQTRYGADVDKAQNTANSAYNVANGSAGTIADWTTIAAGGKTTIEGGKVNTTMINASYLSVDAIKSGNYKYNNSAINITTGYTTQGSYFDLVNGTIHTPGFYTTSNGNAYFKGHVEATSLTLGNNVKVPATGVSGLSNIAISGDYNDLKNQPKIPTSVTDLGLDPNGIVYKGDISQTQKTDNNGNPYIETTVPTANGNVTYSTYDAEDYMVFGRSKGTDSAGSNYISLSKEGLLTARNALVYGTIYATDGEFAGKLNAATGSFKGSLEVGNAFKVNANANGSFGGAKLGDITIASNGAVTLGGNTTISWDNVTEKDNVASTTDVSNAQNAAINAASADATNKANAAQANAVSTIEGKGYQNATQVTTISRTEISTATINANQINANNLSAISANIGTVNAGILRSNNANCEGTNIAAFTGLTINLTNPSICGPGFKIDSTGGQFSGSLSGANITGATGTFSGSLNVGNYFSVDANNKTFRAGGLSVAANGSTTVEGAIKATSLTITSTAAASAGLATSNELSNVSNIANNASATANNVSTIANNAYNVANNASATANNASSVANNVSTIANNAYNVANNASNVANNASATANSAYGQANTAYNVANNASTTANTAYGQANTAYNVANSAYGQANTATTIANNASNVANAAQGAANNAYNIANTATNQINAWKTGNTKLTGTTEISGGNITADHLSISAITSPNCTVVNGYTNEGSHFDLINGTIHTPGFYTTPEGDAHFKGSIESNSGKIAKWDISQDSISKGDVALIATDTQPFDYKLGSESKSSYIRFKAGTKRVQRIESEVLQVNYNADGYIIIGDETQYSKTTCVYRSQKNNQYLSKIYTSIPDYTVNFEYQSSPWHYYKLTSSKSYVTHTVYLTVFYEYSTYDEWPTHCILKDGTVFLQATHFGAPTQGMILEEVGYGVKLRPNLSDLVSWDENPGTKTGIFLLNHSQIANGSYINVRSNTDATSMIHDGIYFQSSSGAYTKAWITSKSLDETPTGSLYFNNVQYVGSSVSDAHLKHSIELLPQIYETFFDKLQPTRYKYIDGTSNRYHTGFIAQQVVASLEDSGLTTQDFAAVVLQDPGTEREFWQLRRDEFVALNTWQIQKLKTRMVESETKVELLEAEILSLKTELQNLKNK